MQWTPLRLTTPTRAHVFGGTLIRDRLGRDDLSPRRIAETWEVSDVDGDIARVVDGPLIGRSLRELTLGYPDEMVGPGWRGPHFPILTKFIDGTGMLPVHLHANDEAARRLERQPNGKTEAWHILHAEVGATALVGVKPGVDRNALRDALLRQDFDAVMRRLPVRAGETILVPGGALHSFGPTTLIYEIEQTSNIQQHAMDRTMEDGSPIPAEQRRANIEALLAEWDPAPRPEFLPPLRIPVGDGVDRAMLCASPFFVLERWRVAAGTRLDHRFDRATILSNVGGAMRLQAGDWSGELGPARTLLLPAALAGCSVEGPADLLMGSLPDLDRDVRAVLAGAGHGKSVIDAMVAGGS